MAPTTPLCIAVITFNRCSRLRKTLAAIEMFTTTPYSLFIADDGSADGTGDFLRAAGIAHHSSRNRGVAWNKNRALFNFLQATKAQTLIMLEDDTAPTQTGWEQDWIEAVQRYGHVNFGGDWFLTDHEIGRGTAQEPIDSDTLTAQCSAFSRQALQKAGFFDSRFRGFGCEHVEHTERLVRAGFGGFLETTENGGKYHFYLLRAPLRVARIDSFGTDDSIAAAKITYATIKDGPIYRDPWQNDDEKQIFLAEMTASGIDITQFAETPPAAQTAPAEPKPRPPWYRRLLGGK
jgi:glycosyltransferase involved in cell wall biosynthesis